MAYAEQRTPEILKQAFLCSECNLCSGLHACPMQLSPKRVNQELKKALKAEGVRPDFQKREIKDHPLREYRLLPSSRLVRRLGLAPYDVHVPFRGEVFPAEVRIPLTQHLGAPSVPVVSVGDSVEKGQLLAEIPEGALGARIHASVKGTVAEVSPQGIRIVAEKTEG
jgi:Na+-translocating ferredoxin:NAD+ oxidoreductase RnfC subunit